jgi:hypothetical protein
MARYSAGARASGAGSNILPIGSIFSAAAINFRLREIGVFNTTTTAMVVGLARLGTNQGTPGTGLTETSHDFSTATASCTTFNTHTAQGTMTLTDLGYRATLGAAAGAGVIWTFGGDLGINANVGTTNGIGIYVPTGTGQITDFYLVWEE